MFEPAYIIRHQKGKTSPLTYTVRTIRGRRYLILRITAAMGKRCGYMHGHPVRLDLNKKTRQARLVIVTLSSHHLSQGRPGSQQAYSVTWPHTGDLEAHFPIAPRVTPLVVLDASVSDGLYFEFPTPA